MANKEVAVIFLLLVAIQGSLAIGCSARIENQKFPPEKCFLSKVHGIPHWHIFRRLSPLNRPLVMGHRGNPQEAQENSLDGIKSVPRFGGDGFEVDVFMTKDKHLVCFHDKNTARLTGFDGDIEEMTKSEIQQLEYKKVITYGTQEKVYSKKRPIAFLEEVLDWAKNTKLLVYIEMKPEPVLDPMLRKQQIARSFEMVKRVTQLVSDKGMVPQVMMNSFDPLKSFYAKMIVPDQVIGTSWTTEYWLMRPFMHDLQRMELMALFPGLRTCLDDITTVNNEFIDFLFQSGSVEKSIGASFMDIDFTMFNNTAYGGINHTTCVLKKNYGWHIAIAAYTLFDLSKTPAQIDSEKSRYMDLVKDGVDLFYTDDICGMIDIVQRLQHYRRHFYSYCRYSGRHQSEAYVSRRSHRRQYHSPPSPKNSNDVEEHTAMI